MLFPVICDYRKEGTGLRAIRSEAKRRKKLREAAWRCALLRLDSLKAFCCVVFAIQSCETREIVTDQNFKSMRNAMVESQLRTSDVNDPRVIAAMARVPREAFLPTERQALAYIDRPVKLSEGRSKIPPLAPGRLLPEGSDERRVGKECGGQFKSRGAA